MTITIAIRSELEAELARQAAANGSAIEAYATALLEQALHLPSAPPSQAGTKDDLIELAKPVRGLLTDAEVDQLFRRNPSTARPVDL